MLQTTELIERQAELDKERDLRFRAWRKEDVKFAKDAMKSSLLSALIGFGGGLAAVGLAYLLANGMW